MSLQTFPQDPIIAVTHPNPYPYYADLVANKPIYRDQTSGLWVASSAAAVTAILTSDLCRVRPMAESVPQSLIGSFADNIFQHLVRMNDGQKHSTLKPIVSSTLASIDSIETAKQASKWAQFLFDEIRLDAYADRLSDFAFQLPIYVVASLLGVPENKLHQTAHWISEFVRSSAPSGSQEHIEQGIVAAGRLLELFHLLFASQQRETTTDLILTFARKAELDGEMDTNAIVANSIGFLSQTYEATAGLIGNTLVALASHHDIREKVIADSDLLINVIREVLRFDPPVQNTRRFLAQDGIVAGQRMNKGDAILVVLAAANRDPLANPNPEQFDIFRQHRQSFTFGVGIHACPGETLATAIATEGVKYLIASGVRLDELVRMVEYRPSANTRIPLFIR